MAGSFSKFLEKDGWQSGRCKSLQFGKKLSGLSRFGGVFSARPGQSILLVVEKSKQDKLFPGEEKMRNSTEFVNSAGLGKFEPKIYPKNGS